MLVEVTGALVEPQTLGISFYVPSLERSHCVRVYRKDAGGAAVPGRKLLEFLLDNAEAWAEWQLDRAELRHGRG